VPLKWEAQIIGGIDILNDPDGRSFDRNDIWLLSGFADLASIAVKNAELHTQIKQFQPGTGAKGGGEDCRAVAGKR